MLDPWVIEEILKREEEKRRREEEQRREQPTVPADDPREMPAERRPDTDREMPSDRKPGYEMPNPNEPARPPAEKKEDDGQRRGVDISRISGGDEEDENDGSISIDISKIPPAFPEDGKKDEKRPE